MSKNNRTQATYGKGGKLTNLSGLAEITGVPARTLRTLHQTRKISGIRAGWRTLLFNPEEVLAELNRFKVKAVA